MDRRTFLRTGTGGAAGLAVFGQTSPSVSKNDEVVLAVVGINGMGRGHFQLFSQVPGVRIKTICEVDERIWPAARRLASEAGNDKVNFEPDLRRVLDDPDIDAITIATPEHWHSLQAIWACQAGKDAYVEKPVSHNVWEGRKLVEAARKYGRIVASGTQQRTFPHVVEAMRFLHEGVIGEVHMARGLCFKPRESIGKLPDEEAPEGLHWDLWLGPASHRLYNPNYVHYNWHWFWDFGCGDIGNQGVHEMDAARWGLGKTTLPAHIYSAGGYYAFQSDQETPNMQLSVFRWDDGKVLQFEVRGLYTNSEAETRIGNMFYGTEGWMHVDINGFQTFLGREEEPGPAGEAVNLNLEAGGGHAMDRVGRSSERGLGVHNTSRYMHYANFIDAVRTRNPADLTADILEGHLSSSLCHLANIAYRLDTELHFDAHAEKFVDNPRADAYLTRNYRYPYQVPEDL